MKAEQKLCSKQQQKQADILEDAEVIFVLLRSVEKTFVGLQTEQNTDLYWAVTHEPTYGIS